MFSTNTNYHQILHNARQRELEAAAENHRLLQALKDKNGITPLRQRVGSLLIELGEKVAQQPSQDIRLAISARQ